jgi:two-component system phosphate regulon sensor histidine kinase PhoR
VSDQQYVAVSVTDTGPGIEREHLPRLAERFYRIEGQKSGDQPGTGLGLSIVKHVVNRHRGGLSVESTPGGGSVFTAYFPMLDGKVASIIPPASRESAAPNAATKAS